MDYTKEWYISVLNSINDLILVKGDKSKLLWANKAFRDLYNMSNEELINIVDSESSDPDDTVQYVKDDHYVFTNGVTLDIPSEAVSNNNGEISYYHTIKNPIKNTKGNVIRTVGVSRLINDDDLLEKSKRKRLEQKTDIQDLKTFVQSIPSPVIMLDLSNRIIASSDAWVDYFEQTKEDIIWADFFERYTNKLPFKDKVEECVTTSKKVTLDSVSIDLKNQVSHFQVIFNPWIMSSGDVGGVMLMLNDITSQVEKEKTLQKYNEELKQFAYITTHDIKSPITNIESFLSLLKMDDKIQDQRSLQAIHWIQKSIEQANEKITDLVQVIQQREQAIENEVINLNLFISTVVDKYRDAIYEIEGEVKLELTGDIFLSTSRKQLQTILDNLLTNAIRYKDRNRMLIIKINIQNTAVDHCLISVEDNGIGIDLSKHRERIFDMFKRANDSTEGSGLGLYLSQQAAEQLNATIEVESEIRKGTKFIIKLPK
ncbi:ATP-binding protein [Flammeovirga kamogawensis]|uniref:histidine kinase n=1 Tax=Flammeovirga kamogawensis TaxID=373891 RepID=A0ABX8GV60_9BACT|nr:ATP-binding protein [Flammeovirga kamogawensis]MBB6459644.1 signal transduction histidine kinase [Flammeovirga kamogawensis]QWG07293.1 PAS domain-containing sensor histidine kinase [Flammeovirga kamogawensis]TRX69110.1 PAS domain-containing protein [Flammeovirga kamogawensis]